MTKTSFLLGQVNDDTVPSCISAMKEQIRADQHGGGCLMWGGRELGCREASCCVGALKRAGLGSRAVGILREALTGDSETLIFQVTA